MTRPRSGSSSSRRSTVEHASPPAGRARGIRVNLPSRDCGGAVAAYDRLLESVGRRAAEIEPTRILVHWPHVGSRYRGLVIMGQAVRGWPDDFAASDFREAGGRAVAINTARCRNADRADPLDWIDANPVHTSPFWRASRILTEELEGDATSPWFSRYCWLNLFPCAPADPIGNPSGALKESQDPFVGSLLRAHAEWLDARVIVGFVGPFWWPAAEAAGLSELPEAPRPLLRAGRDRDGRIWVIGWHPNGASHRRWGPARYAWLIAETVRALEAPNGRDLTGLSVRQDGSEYQVGSE